MPTKNGYAVKSSIVEVISIRIWRAMTWGQIIDNKIQAICGSLETWAKVGNFWSMDLKVFKGYPKKFYFEKAPYSEKGCNIVEVQTIKIFLLWIPSKGQFLNMWNI